MADKPAEQTTTDTQTTTTTTEAAPAFDTAYVEGLKKQLSEFKTKTKEYETQSKQQQEASMRQKEEWQKLAELKETEAKEYKTKFDGLQQSLIVEKKYNALKNEAVKLGLRQEAISDLELVDLSDIQIESTSTGKMNVLGAEKYAERLKAIRPHWFGGNAPNVNTGNLRVTGNDSVDAKSILKAEAEGRKSGDMTEYKRLISLRMNKK